MKIILTTILLASTFMVFGQTFFNYQADFKRILERTKDTNDNLFYNKLLKRFSVNDTTLTDFEVLSLLIGFTDKSEYKPYKDLAKEREIYKLNGEKKYRESIDSAVRFIKFHPLSVQAFCEMGYSYYKLGINDSSQFYGYKGQRIFEAMYFSGNGKSPETPAFALGPADGQDFIHRFVRADIGTMGSGSDKNGNFLDILEAKFENGESMNLYFIIQHATNKMFSEDEKLKMKNMIK